MIYMHFYKHADKDGFDECHWYIVARSTPSSFHCYHVTNDRLADSSWANLSDEAVNRELNPDTQIIRDTDWQPRTAWNVSLIRMAYQVKGKWETERPKGT